MAAFLRAFVAVILLMGTASTAVRESWSQAPGKKDVVGRTDRQNPYLPPRVISKVKDGVVEVSLDVNFETVEVERMATDADGLSTIIKDKLRVRTYKSKGDAAGNMIANVIRVKAGQTLTVKLTNSINPKEQPDGPIVHNHPGGFNRTNLHTHGLHVSPEGASDNVFLDLGPGDEKAYTFKIPDNHVAGTMWFHAHRHGSTALQLASGMAGALIVDPGPAKGGIDNVPEIETAMKDEREKILVFQQLRYHMVDGVGIVTKEDVYGGSKETIEVDLINGEFQPLIKMKRSEIQRWRCVHGGISSELNLAVVKRNVAGAAVIDGMPWTLHEMAADGIPFKAIHTPKNVWLYPGYRSDFLLEAPDEDGDFALVHLPTEPGKAFRKNSKVSSTPKVLARIRVEGEGPKMKLPTTESIKPYAPPDIEEVSNPMAPRSLVFDIGLGYTINGKEFDSDKPGITVKVGTAEEWELKSDSDRHPFHIHVNPFQVILQKDDKGKIVRSIWRDTYFFTDLDTKPASLRMRFEDFHGKTVLHCHNLAHEDQGMMMAIQIDPKDKDKAKLPRPKGMASLPAKTPAWALRDVEERQRRHEEFAGKAHIVVFYRGFACEHCRIQLENLAKRQDKFASHNLTIIAISPDSSADLKKTLTDELRNRYRALTLLADPELDAFRSFGCLDGRQPMHGVFLINAQGQVQWQHVSDSPLTEIEDLLTIARKIAPGSGSDR